MWHTRRCTELRRLSTPCGVCYCTYIVQCIREDFCIDALWLLLQVSVFPQGFFTPTLGKGGDGCAIERYS